MGADTRPGAAGIPCKAAREGLFAEVTIDQVAQRGDGLVRMGSIGAHCDRHPLAHLKGQDAQDAFRVSHGAIFDDFDLRVLELRGGLHEERRRPRMQADLVGDRQRTFGDRLARLLT